MVASLEAILNLRIGELSFGSDQEYRSRNQEEEGKQVINQKNDT